MQVVHRTFPVLAEEGQETAKEVAQPKSSGGEGIPIVDKIKASTLNTMLLEPTEISTSTKLSEPPYERYYIS